MDEDDFLMLSEIQHFAFCRRQWALIHIENQWVENGLTASGRVFHDNAHDGQKVEKRGNMIIMRDLHVKSYQCGVSGICDVVEFHKDPDGITLHGYDGLWQPYPVEYKHGKPKTNDADRLQLCGQAMCLEEMLACKISEAALYYKQTKHREVVRLSDELRSEFMKLAEEMHGYKKRGYTPKVKKHSGCKSCSLKDICLPGLDKKQDISIYMNSYLTGGDLT